MNQQLSGADGGTAPAQFEARFLTPRYWGSWGVVGLLRGVSFLPYPGRILVGQLAGSLLHILMPRRRRIADINLQLCFPELSDAQRRRMVRRHFLCLGVALIEMGAAWWASDQRIRKLAHIKGIEHLDEALSRGRGAIMLSAHFTSMEMGLRLFSQVRYGYAIYRPQNNPLLDWVIRSGRGRHRGKMFPREDMRTMLRALKANHPVWYPPDQDYGRRHSVFAEFFGHPAATITMTARIAKISGAPVVPFYFRRLPGFKGYELVFHPPLEDFPSGDDVADASRLNAVLETEIRGNIEQYLWVHRRFKTRPENLPGVYAQ